MLNAFAYLGFSDIRKIERMTLVEYELRMEAYQLKQVDRQNEIAQQAWMNQQVQATTGSKNPKPKFKTFDDFFDKKAAIDSVRSNYEPNYEVSQMSKTELKQKRAQVFAKRMAEFQRLKREGKIIPLSERKEGAHG
ncbi:hypothetical protein [Lacticaseibacillus phage R9.1]|nr:hypothetical protein [Lacticaseibacillus phage R9.1]